ncbi:hypothetical protein COO60DRAFT_1666296 [Scenedesmus sp. NREL 46B-D3]|nr:hypothetical protein COO60DRAFT_1666296 [Scenedesmus sp. NREL 46B-D3]
MQQRCSSAWSRNIGKRLSQRRSAAATRLASCRQHYKPALGCCKQSLSLGGSFRDDRRAHYQHVIPLRRLCKHAVALHQGIVKTLRRFNLSCMRYDTYVHGHGWRAWDVVRLFTNIDKADLLSRIRQLLKRAWIQQLPALNASRQGQGTMASQQTAVLQVFANKSVPVWHTSIDHAYLVYGRPEQAGIFSRGRMNNDRAGFDSCCGGFHLMTLAEAQTMSGLLIQQAYVRFEDTVYHQTTGIPMGINPAVYYANLYLVSYELDFLEQFLPLLRIGRNIPAVPVYPGPMTQRRSVLIKHMSQVLFFPILSCMTGGAYRVLHPLQHCVFSMLRLARHERRHTTYYMADFVT